MPAENCTASPRPAASCLTARPINFGHYRLQGHMTRQRLSMGAIMTLDIPKKNAVMIFLASISSIAPQQLTANVRKS